MKYMVIIYGNQELWSSFTQEEMSKAIAEQDAYNAKYRVTGELLGAYGLGDATMAKVVAVRDGETTVTDGPYIETNEYCASFNLLDVESEERALELAAEMPFASFRSVEVWPVLHEAPTD